VLAGDGVVTRDMRERVLVLQAAATCCLPQTSLLEEAHRARLASVRGECWRLARSERPWGALRAIMPATRCLDKAVASGGRCCECRLRAGEAR
jgi:hypothetical protein